MPTAYHWDPAQYTRYAELRDRPFHELVARIPLESPARVVDIGCGPGSLTRSLADRWPDAHVTGVDSSLDMIDAAASFAVPGRLDFVCADLSAWRPDGPVDVVVGNAVLQWVPGHLGLLGELAGWLAPGGTLAFQVPDNFDEPSHVIARDLRLSPRWRDRVGEGADRTVAVERPEVYLTRLADLGLHPDVWQTTYLQVLHGEDPVLEWIKGTALRPVLDALADDPDATRAFLAECAPALREAYPSGEHGTLFPFRRTFAVGTRRSSRP
jgi:trans-aconitate 2-methyltransferase